MMADERAWHEQDEFWELFGPILFNARRHADAETEVDRLITLLNIRIEDRILDLCCGPGRHSLVLARRGYEVSGIDRTDSYIEEAKRSAEEEHLHVSFLVADMRDYRPPETFDVVLNLFGSFGYFEDPQDDRQVVQNMHASLREGGRFLIETMGKEILARDFSERDWSEEGDALVLAERKVNEDWGRIQTRWIVIQDHRRTEHTVSVRSYSAAELASLVKDCGFSDVAVYGDIEGKPYDHDAKRLVVLATK